MSPAIEAIMPRPQAFQTAQQVFDGFLDTTMEALELPSRNAANTALEAYLRVRCARMTADELIAFANGLPPMIAALAIRSRSETDTSEAYADDAARDAAMRSLRTHHNFVPVGSSRVMDALVSGLQQR